jgi:hypothetical protein
MGEEWAGFVVSFLALLVPILTFVIFDVAAWRMPGSSHSETSRRAEPHLTFPYRPLWTKSSIEDYRGDLTRRAQQWLTWASLTVPLATLVYGAAPVNVGTMFSFRLTSLAASVVAFVFAATCTPLARLVAAGSHRAARAASMICNVFHWMFFILFGLFGLATLFALTRVFGIEYFLPKLDNPGPIVAHTSILTAVSAMAWQATEKSADLLAATNRYNQSG